jgi:oxygen-dependent protoporphyrinogen oxidase
MSTIIIGAGLSGLALAHTLHSRGEDVQILEANVRAGGHVRTICKNGYLIEAGPNTLQVNDPAIEQFLEQNHLIDNAIEANPSASKRYIVRNRKPTAVPSSPLSGITSNLFSWKAKWNLATEAFVSQAHIHDESLANFVRRRLGQEFLDYAINPMVGGVYAGDPEKLSVKHAFPKVWSLEAEHGSLIRGALARMKQRRKEGSQFKTRLLSWPEGMDTLTRTLAAPLNISTNVRITHIEPHVEGWRIDWEDESNGHTQTCRKLIVSIPAFSVTGLPFPQVIRDQLSSLNTIPYPPVSMLAMGFKREAITHPLDGFGMLVPEVEHFNILGTLFSSTLFPARAPDGHVLLTTFIGGARNPDLARKDTETLKAKTLKDLNTLLGVSEEPTLCEHFFWPRAIPQYGTNHQKHIDTLKRVEHAHGGLYFIGNYRNGIAAGKCLMAAEDSYQRIFDE